MPSSVRTLPLALLIAMASGCVRISATPFGAPAAAPTPVDSVRVFATSSPPAYTEVAVLRARRFLVSDTKVLMALRRQAAALGANGIMLLNTRGDGSRTTSGSGIIVGGPNSGSVIVGNGTSEVDSFERAVAIRWTSSPAASQAVRTP